MNIATVRAFFMWCTIINVGLMTLAFLICTLGGDWVYRVHSRFIPIKREAFDIAVYSFLGVFKILVFVFNLVPYIALVIVG
ncbi:MAG: hypothetical protein KAI66_00395 [Lentisphaeria bacterium]|nr:hypothetical protein [Lentisphaeria bacterium]